MKIESRTAAHKVYSRISPIQKVLLSFFLLIMSGTALLMLPVSTTRGITFIDALFTSTSAVCVTGLIVVDTATGFTFFGQIVILLLIQFGGLGIMTFTIALIALAGGDFSIQWRFTFESFYSDIKRLPVKGILRRIILYTFGIELFFALVLFTQFINHFGMAEAIWHSIFHSISAFCNAGFSTFPENLAGFCNNVVVMIGVGSDIIMGGLGFLVLTELFRMRLRRGVRLSTQLSLHSKIVLAVTVLLIFGGMLFICLLEWNHLFKEMSVRTKLLSGFFQSVTCRTAGFNSVDIGRLRDSTLFIMTALMFIGGSPGSIAGGIKTTSAAVVTALLYSRFKNRDQVVFWGKGIPHGTVDKSVTLTFMALLVISTATFFLLGFNYLDRDVRFLEALFEVTSALNTVGLSTGITPRIPASGKFILVLVMYIGRLGPLTLVAALTSMQKNVAISYVEDDIMIG
jgi:trk system potassium uptake protein